MTDKRPPEPPEASPPEGNDAFDTAETLVTPAAGVTPDGEPNLSTASITGLDQDVTHEIPKDPQLRFGRFVTESTIGKGGMGVVFKAVDPLIGRTVAIKALRTDHGIADDSQDELQSRFELEFKSAGTLSHPNIVTIYDVGQEDDTTFIAMEFIDGRSLEQLLREGDVLSFERIGDLVRGICAGLDYAHDAGIVHRDVKPANILIDPAKGLPKITDFGVAKVQSSGLTQTGTVIGTPAYMSPEQILGKEVSGRSDQFSAAVILYQMLTGELPFGSDAPASILFRIVHNEPTPPHELNPDLPEAVSHTMAKALAKEPEDRFETCVDMAEAVTKALLGQEVHFEDAGDGESTSFKSVTLSTTEPLRGSGTYAGAASWWQRQNAAPRLGLSLLGALLFAAIGWVTVANVMGRDAVPFDLPFDAPFLKAGTKARLADAATEINPADGAGTSSSGTDASDPPRIEEDNAAAELAADEPAVTRAFAINSNPAGATVRIDGQAQQGTTPLTGVELAVGRTYDIRVSLADYRGASSNFTVADQDAGQDDTIFFSLQPDVRPGSIAVQKPAGWGEVILESGGRRLNPERVAPGVYQVVVRSPANYLTLDPQQVTVSEGQASELKLPQLQKIRIISIGRGTLSVDGGGELELPANLWLQRNSSHRFSFTFATGEKREKTLLIGSTTARIVGSPAEIKASR